MTQISLPAGAEQCVTSSDLVRQFGVWQDRAARAPVYVLHRGRPRLVLVAIDLMDALCAPLAREPNDPTTLLAVMEAIPDPVVTTSRDGVVMLANAAARARLGPDARAGAALRQLSRSSGGFLEDAARRVAAGGVPEEIEIVPDRYPDRRIECRLDPLPDGAVLHTRDMSADQEAAHQRAYVEALNAALRASDGVATASINARGYLAAPDAALARLTGTRVEQLAAARFVGMLDVADRVRASEAVEQVFATGTARALDATLLVQGAAGTTVHIALSPVGAHGRVEEVLALIRRDTTPPAARAA